MYDVSVKILKILYSESAQLLWNISLEYIAFPISSINVSRAQANFLNAY